MKLASHGIGRLVVLALLALGCAARQKSQSETAARAKDSAPDKIAAQRAAARGLANVGANQPVDVRQAPPPRVNS